MTTPLKVTNRPIALLTPSHANTNTRTSLAPPTPSSTLHHQQSLQETFTVLGELTHEFKNHSDELALINKLLQKKKEISQLIHTKQSQMKDTITTITQQASDLNRLTSNPPNIGLQEQQKLLHQQKASVAAQIHSLTQEIEKLEAQGVEMTKQKQALEQQKMDSEKAKAKQMPSMAGTMGLYRNFSSIAWDYDADATTSVKGTFHFDRTHSIKQFSFDRKTMSEFDIANQLWTMMENAY